MVLEVKMNREIVTDDERIFFYAGKKLPAIYLEYLNYLRHVKKLATGTVQNRKAPTLKFLLEFKKQNTPSTIGSLEPAQIQDYTLSTAAKLSKHQKRSFIIALRDFFHFLHFSKYTKTDLSICVPAVMSFRHSSVPKGMPWKVVEQLLKVPNQKTFCGKRDYAIILILARYGVRSIQLRALKMNDIDWKKGIIRFAACKGGNDVVVPLLPDVAKALIAYFKAGRKLAPQKYTEVFLTSGTYGSRASGQRPLAESTWNIVANAFKKIAMETSPIHKRGPHAIRHAYATKLLAENEPIKSIADLLGHKSIDTTFIYTKASVESLRPLTKEWPERQEFLK